MHMNGPIFSCFDATVRLQKSPKNYQSVLPDEICLIYDVKGAFWHFKWSQNNGTYKTEITSRYGYFKLAVAKFSTEIYIA